MLKCIERGTNCLIGAVREDGNVDNGDTVDNADSGDSGETVGCQRGQIGFLGKKGFGAGSMWVLLADAAYIATHPPTRCYRLSTVAVGKLLGYVPGCSRCYSMRT